MNKKLIRILLTSGAIIAFSYKYLGPFLVSRPWRTFEAIVDQSEALSIAVNLESIMLSFLVSSTVPLFLVWGILSLLYSWKSYDKIRKYLWLFTFFTGKPGTLIACIGLIFSGVCIYFINNSEINTSIYIAIRLYAATTVGILLSGAGFVFKEKSNPEFISNSNLNKYSTKIGFGCLLISATTYVYVSYIEPIIKYLTIYHSLTASG